MLLGLRGSILQPPGDGESRLSDQANGQSMRGRHSDQTTARDQLAKAQQILSMLRPTLTVGFTNPSNYIKTAFLLTVKEHPNKAS